jgi:hypothetical protein
MRTIKLSMARILTAAIATLIGAALLCPQQRSIKRLDGSRITPAEIDRTVAH